MYKLLFNIILIGLFHTAAAQPFVTFGPTLTNLSVGGELQAGYRYKNVYASVGYISTLNRSYPQLFQARVGYTYESFVVYAGAVRVTKSSYDKSVNYTTYSVGAQWHFCYYDRGTIFLTGSYTPGYTTAGVGMSFNLYRE